jgi:uncharacterized protein
MIDIKVEDNSVSFSVRVIPQSSKSEIVGEHDGAMKVKLKAPPVDGAANDEMIRLLAKELGVSRSEVEITSGQTSKIKRIRVFGIHTDQLRRLFTNEVADRMHNRPVQFD